MITHKQLTKLKKQLTDLRKRKGNITSREMEQFANKCGRYRMNRGKEPTYVSEEFPNTRPLSIPSHGKGATLSIGTAGNILDSLEQDLFMIEEKLDGQTGGGDE